MNIIPAFVNLVVKILINLGDTIIFIILSPVKIISGEPLFETPIKLKRKVRSGTFKLPAKKKPRKRIAFMAIFFGSFWKWYLTRATVKRGRRTTSQRKLARLRNGIHRPSFLYKLKYVFIGFVFSFVFLFAPLVSLIFVQDLPNPANLSLNHIPKTTKIYDRNGNLLYEIFANQNRTVVSLEDIPKALRDATVAIEDRDFYNHPGFDLRGIVRAAVSNLQGAELQGGSTITQQLIKSAFLTPEPTIIR